MCTVRYGTGALWYVWMRSPDSKVHGANMGPIWGRQHSGGPHVGPMNFAIWVTHHTPLWKSNRNFFSTQIFYHLFFVVCSSFYTWYMWGGQYQFCKFSLDFDHWLYISDILEKVTGSKPNVGLVWFMQWEKMELEHGEKDRYWCIVRV